MIDLPKPLRCSPIINYLYHIINIHVFKFIQIQFIAHFNYMKLSCNQVVNMFLLSSFFLSVSLSVTFFCHYQPLEA